MLHIPNLIPRPIHFFGAVLMVVDTGCKPASMDQSRSVESRSAQSDTVESDTVQSSTVESNSIEYKSVQSNSVESNSKPVPAATSGSRVADSNSTENLLAQQEVSPESAPQSAEPPANNTSTVPASAPLMVDARLERKKRVIETEALIAKSLYDVLQQPATQEEADWLREVEFNRQVYRLLAEDIDNDA